MTTEQAPREQEAAQPRPAPEHPLAWARRLELEHKAGRRLSPFQIQSYRQALGLEGPQDWQ